MKNVITVKNVSVKYIIGDFKNTGLKDFIIKKIKGNYVEKEFYANKNINFTLKKGDCLGIIGINGAGKSTLLKAIAGVLKEESGTIEVNGKIAALIELGAGFDFELTVKENTFLRGALLGYSEEFMHQKYEEIINFAELNGYEDRPYKQLSSGMKSRLAFSIASLVNPDVLIIDEVLAVGDGGFREKSEKKMKEIINNGTTTLFVSHSLKQIQDVCNKILWLDNGSQIVLSDDVNKTLREYVKYLKTRKLPK